jgi:predicted enzyme related to lactoylglutathione lyase
MKKRVTGIGGVFFKANDPKKLTEWYGRHLGLHTAEWGGATFQWRELDAPSSAAPATTAWSPFSSDTKYFQPADKTFMINYRVENLEELLAVLRQEGVQIVGNMETHPYGKFGWIMDPDGNKIELWQPLDDTPEETKP